MTPQGAFRVITERERELVIVATADAFRSVSNRLALLERTTTGPDEVLAQLRAFLCNAVEVFS